MVPDPIDRLRVLLGHALFQQRGLNLPQLLIVWDLMHPGVVAAPRREAEREGWQRGFDEMVANVDEAISLLDEGQPIGLPVPPPAPAFARGEQGYFASSAT